MTPGYSWVVDGFSPEVQLCGPSKVVNTLEKFTGHVDDVKVLMHLGCPTITPFQSSAQVPGDIVDV